MPLTISHLNPVLLLMMKMRTTFLFHLRQIRAEDHCTLDKQIKANSVVKTNLKTNQHVQHVENNAPGETK